MFSDDFRHIALRGEQDRSDRLLRAAATAFCSLTRPTKRDARQLSQLALPLYGRASADARRYIAAALSDLVEAPPDLVARLANDRLDIAAPALKRSPLLNDLDLLAIIARHGLGHARVIARRRNLNPTIASLVKALEASDSATSAEEEDPTAGPAQTSRLARSGEPSRAEAIRDRLRSMMQAADNHAAPAQDVGPTHANPQFELDRIRRTMASRLAAQGQARRGAPVSGRMFGSATIGDVAAAMKSLAIAEDKALLVACSAFPERFLDVSGVTEFVRMYRRTEALPQRPGRPDASRIVKLVRRATGS